ncbi:hypothetical protein F5Y14DRAFT_192578 [Nemania sp. NC0429]|nr:hypothetical protein F5Y14DRAFT_192578 [Nemania sp. NC0429]
MPPSHELITDEYVAELLTKEANDCSLKYSSLGLDAFKSDKRPANQPKPNTRFLNTIIRDTNSHNRALLARENAEAKARLRNLEETDRQKRDEHERKQQRAKPGPRDTRKRMLGDIAAILGGGPSKRRRPDGADENTTRTAPDKRAKYEHDVRDDSDRTGRSRRDDAKPKSKNNRPKSKNNRPKSQSRSRSRSESRSRSRSRSQSRRRRDDHRSDSRDGHRHSHRRSERHRDRRPRSREDLGDKHRRRRERSPRERDDGHRHHHHSEKEIREPAPSSSKDDDSDSDPLDDIIGPAPPSKSAVRRRGRGHIAAMSGIDSRFASDYDPTIDVAPDSDGENNAGDDWDNAVEAFRDRQKWKQQGAERLRSAGFSEEQVKKWEKGDRKDESDVQWDKAGGVREWDRGKVVDADGGVSPDLEFGRLKGT